jgi:hypothetical protein
MKPGLFVLTLCLLPCCAHAEPIDLKTGGWEVSVTTTGAGETDKQSFQSCVTKEGLASGSVFESEDETNCTRKVIRRSAQRFEFDEACREPEPSKGHMSFEAKSREAYVGSIDRTLQGGAQVHIEMSGHWVSATCSDDVDD